MGVIERIMDDGVSPSDWRAVIEDRPLLVSVSGGKDSTAVVLWLREQGLADRCYYVFADTGWEHPATYDYIDNVLEPLCNGRLERVKSRWWDKGFPDMVRAKGRFPSMVHRFCTRDLKVRPIALYFRELRREHPGIISVVGVRAAESKPRSKLEMFDRGGPLGKWVDVWRPLIHWTVQDVIDIHTRNNIKPCSLYYGERSVARVGCWPCIYSRKKDIRHVVETDPERIALIRELEAEVTQATKDKAKAEGKVLPEDYKETFFQNRSTTKKGAWSIDEVAAWSRTKHGGKEEEPFMPDNTGCQMWGLCDLGGDSDANQ